MPAPINRWSILDHAPDATLVTSVDGTIVYANSRTDEMLGWVPTDLVGQHVEVLVPSHLRRQHESRRSAYAHSPRARMMGAGLELAALRHDGSEVAVEIALNPVTDGDEMFVVASVRDISERVRLSEELSSANARLAVLDERDRIARDLHDGVIQRLFAAGLHLQASVGRADHEERLAVVIDEIDEAIKQIRSTIFTLHRPHDLHEGLEPAIRSVVAEASRVLGHEPKLLVDGDLSVVAPDLVDDVTHVVRELLTNVAKHANATSSSVKIACDEARVVVEVHDDGRGLAMTAARAGQGLTNIGHRARQRGGTVTFSTGDERGTRVVWEAPLS